MSPRLQSAAGNLTFLACILGATILALAGPAPAADTPVIPRERPRAVVPMPPPPPDRVQPNARIRIERGEPAKPEPRTLPVVTCGDRDAMRRQLSERYGEAQRMVAFDRDRQRVVDFYRHPETGAWTLLVSAEAGAVSCIVATGEASLVLPVRAPWVRS